LGSLQNQVDLGKVINVALAVWTRQFGNVNLTTYQSKLGILAMWTRQAGKCALGKLAKWEESTWQNCQAFAIPIGSLLPYTWIWKKIGIFSSPSIITHPLEYLGQCSISSTWTIHHPIAFNLWVRFTLYTSLSYL
jgi:hypothetical protein